MTDDRLDEYGNWLVIIKGTADRSDAQIVEKYSFESTTMMRSVEKALEIFSNDYFDRENDGDVTVQGSVTHLSIEPFDVKYVRT